MEEPQEVNVGTIPVVETEGHTIQEYLSYVPIAAPAKVFYTATQEDIRYWKNYLYTSLPMVVFA